MTDEAVVRDATLADEAAIVALWRSCGLIASPNDPVADFRLALDGPSSTVLVADGEDNAIVGAMMVGHDGHRGWFYYVATDPTRRREGIGRAMVAAAEQWLFARDIPKAQLLVRDTNLAVAAFYERLGYGFAPHVFMQKWLKL